MSQPELVKLALQYQRYYISSLILSGVVNHSDYIDEELFGRNDLLELSSVPFNSRDWLDIRELQYDIKTNLIALLNSQLVQSIQYVKP